MTVIFFRANNTDVGYSSIRMIVGDAEGANFGEPLTLLENYDATKSGGGMWEPYGVLLEDGTIAVYVSCDIRGTSDYVVEEKTVVSANSENLVCTSAQQNILLITLTEESGTFVPSTPSIVCDGVTRNARDGMSVITQLTDGNYAMVIETNYEGTTYPMVIQILYSQDGKEWTEPTTILRASTEGKKMAAPYITTLPDGRIAVSCCSQEGYNGDITSTKSDMYNRVQRVYISQGTVSYGTSDIELKELVYRTYPENEYSIFGGVSYINGRLYLFTGRGENTSAEVNTSKGALINYILY